MITRVFLVLGCMAAVGFAYAEQGQWSGNVSIEARLFPEDALYSEQDDQDFSISFEPEYYWDWRDGEQRIVFKPFFRYDINDDERSHSDIRELYWRGTFGDADLKVGVAKVFWGVTESQHLVDIVNQTDLVENIDTEDKLGQPMVNLNIVKNWGTLELYVLPYFRERTFAGEEGRLRVAIPVDTDHENYESGAEESHVDYAVRWSHYIGNWDIGISHFSGTAREPNLMPSLRNGQVVLTPYYQQIDQTGLDLQATIGSWLWKLEAVSRRDNTGRYTAAVGGFEYTIVGIFGSASDLGLLVEYHFDDRDEESTSPFENDLFTGFRWVTNDVQSTELLAGVIVDSDTQATFGNIEASRRIGQSWKISLELRVFANQDRKDLLYDLRDDDYLEVRLSRYF